MHQIATRSGTTARAHAQAGASPTLRGRAARREAAGGPTPLDQRRDNRLGWVGLGNCEGKYVVGPDRSGGAFDPEGGRAVDVHRADDIVAACQAIGGRWFFVTLTIDRSQFVGPEAAYQRCADRVRKTMAHLGAVWVACIEPQTLTGDGWMHWHVLVRVPGSLDLDEALKRVRSAWSIREKYDESIDVETGEITERFKRVPIGMVHVEVAGSVTGTATYVAKYVMKAWPAVPGWMLDSTSRFRKVRISGEFYNVLERLHRHDRARGSRRDHRRMPVRRVRTLRQRMAMSCARLLVFEKRGDLMTFKQRVAVPIERVTDVCGQASIAAVKLGNWGSVRFEVDQAGLDQLKASAGTLAMSEYRMKRQEERAAMLDRAWARMQARRTGSDELS